MRRLTLCLTVLFAGLLPLAGAAATPADSGRLPVSEEPVAVNKETPNSDCLACHGVKGFAVPRGEFGESRKRALFVDRAALHSSVHSKQSCVACHNTIEQIPHKPDQHRVVGCVQCHEEQAELGRAGEVQTEVDLTRSMVGLPPDLQMLEKTTLEKEAGFYLASIHAQPREDDPQRPNANCGDCHGTHNKNSASVPVNCCQNSCTQKIFRDDHKAPTLNNLKTQIDPVNLKLVTVIAVLNWIPINSSSWDYREHPQKHLQSAPIYIVHSSLLI